MPDAWICTTCGTQSATADQPPAHCVICEDDRQYVGPGGQQWTTLAAIQRAFRNTFETAEPGLTAIQPEPKLGIGQRAFLVQTPAGNLLWDCVALLDNATLDRIRELGGVRAIAISHPHYYTTMVEWSRVLGNVPVHLHRDDAAWVQRPDPCQQFWEGESFSLWEGLTLIRTGGHFPGFQVAHWAAGAEGSGALLAGDQPFVVADRRWVSFMHSYPNLIPLGAGAIRQISASLSPLKFERLYGAFSGQVVDSDARGAVLRSAERYLRAISG